MNNYPAGVDNSDPYFTDESEMREEEPHGRCWGKEFCPHPGQPCIDGCYYCGRPIPNITGDHNHTESEKGRYSCVCDYC